MICKEQSRCKFGAIWEKTSPANSLLSVSLGGWNTLAVIWSPAAVSLWPEENRDSLAATCSFHLETWFQKSVDTPECSIQALQGVPITPPELTDIMHANHSGMNYVWLFRKAWILSLALDYKTL